MRNSIPKTHVPHDEEARLAKLYGYTSSDNYQQYGTFQYVCSMAAQILNMPISVVNLVDRESVWTVSAVGADGIRRTDREISLCSLAILQDKVTVFENARLEPCLLSNPAVSGDFGLQFYAGAPLITPDGFRIGVMAVADTKPREFSEEDAKMLENMAAIVMEELEERAQQTSHSPASVL